MFNKINIFIPTKKVGHERFLIMKNIVNTINCNFSVFFIGNNGTTSMTKMLNNAFKRKIENNAIILFMHDDIEMMTIGWGKKLLELFNNSDYGIIGVAGSTVLYENTPWWQVEENNRLGQVLHKSNDIWLTPYSDIIPNEISQCVVIDGLFIAVNPNLTKKEFDESIEGFHLYDIDFCLNNFLCGVKIGVTTAFRLIHKSIGQTNQMYYKNLEFINNKYKNMFPFKL